MAGTKTYSDKRLTNLLTSDEGCVQICRIRARVTASGGAALGL
jgi:hypothetical protein